MKSKDKEDLKKEVDYIFESQQQDQCISLSVFHSSLLNTDRQTDLQTDIQQVYIAGNIPLIIAVNFQTEALFCLCAPSH